MAGLCLQAWQVAHQPVRGSYFTGTRPAVHRGFQQSWHASDLSKRITQRVLEVVKARYEADPSLLKCKVSLCCMQHMLSLMASPLHACRPCMPDKTQQLLHGCSRC